MATTKAISANAQKPSDAGKIFAGGNNSSTRWGTVTIRDSTAGRKTQGTTLGAGTAKAISAGTYNGYYAGSYIAPFVNTQIAGVATSIIRIPATAPNRRVYGQFLSYNRFNVTSTNLHGQNTYGGSRGAKVYLKNIAGSDLTTGEGYPSKAIPGEFTYRSGAKNPVHGDYKPYNV